MKLGSEILWFSERDVLSLLTMDEALTVVENGFRLYGEGKAQLPPKVYLDFEPYGGDLRTMPAYIKGDSPVSGVKIVNSNAHNPEKGLPAVSGIMVVIDPETGLPKAVMAAGNLTSLRTGAAGGIAAKYMARKNSTKVGLIGCGKQATTQLEALVGNFSLTEARVWGKTPQEAKDFCLKNKSKFAMTLSPVQNIIDACQGDIIVTTTPVRSPLVQTDWISPGTHINAIGADAPGKQELAGTLLKQAKVFVDEWAQASHGGEINKAVSLGEFTKEDIFGSLGDVVAGKTPGRQNDTDMTIFDSTGLAIQDVALANYLFDKAQKLNKGQVLDFHG